MGVLLVLILICVNVPTYKFFYNLIFKDDEDFSESLRYKFTPDIVSLFRGEYRKDRIGEFKLGIFLFLCGITIALEYFIISGIISIFI